MMETTLESILQEVYDSEINVEISSEWDNGYTIRLGCTYSRKFVFEYGGVVGSEMIDVIHDAVLEHYPDSEYALDHRV